jgi:hypothetical protein
MTEKRGRSRVSRPKDQGIEEKESITNIFDLKKEEEQ